MKLSTLLFLVNVDWLGGIFINSNKQVTNNKQFNKLPVK